MPSTLPARRRYAQTRRRPTRDTRRPEPQLPPRPYIDLTNPSAPRMVGSLPTELQSHGEIVLARFAEAVAASAGLARDGAAAASARLASEQKEEQPRNPPVAEKEFEKEEEEEAREGVEPPPLTAARPAQREEGGSGLTDSCRSEENQQAVRPGADGPSVEEQSATGDEALEVPVLFTEAQPLLVDDEPAADRYEIRMNWLGQAERWYTAEEVARHCTRGDLWLVVRGKVFDASDWVEKHPGGATALLRRGGRDASKDFDFHSKRGRALWEATLIGRVHEGASACRGGLISWLLA